MNNEHCIGTTLYGICGGRWARECVMVRLVLLLVFLSCLLHACGGEARHVDPLLGLPPKIFPTRRVGTILILHTESHVAT